MNREELKSRLDNDSSYSTNIELADKVCANEKFAVNFYLSDICMPITSVIERKITHRNIVGEFYEFISAPYDKDTYVPEWHKISLYEGVGCKLSTYTSCIASRHFCKVAKKERKIRQNETEMLDFVDYEALLKCDMSEEMSDSPTLKRMKKAFSLLSDRDKVTLRCTIIEKKSSLDSFPLIERYINPRPKDGLSSQQIKDMWDDKRRQDAVSLIKGRALDHLEQLYNSIK